MANENKPQHQGSLTEQLRELTHVANKEGLYDAADYLERQLADHLRTTVSEAGECTGLMAQWCPRCGDCSCPDAEDGRIGCPLHAEDSPHAEDGLAEPGKPITKFECPGCRASFEVVYGSGKFEIAVIMTPAGGGFPREVVIESNQDYYKL